MKKLSLVIVLLLITIVSIAQYSPKYYREVTIYNNFSNAINNYAGLLIIDTKSLISAGYMKVDGSDIRFSTSKCNFLFTSYWIEKGINTDSTYIWVRIPSIGGYDNTVAYMYYGDNNAVASSNFNATFPARLITSGSSGNITVTTGLKYYGWLEVKAGDTLVLSNNGPIEIIASYIDIQGGINGKGKGNTSTRMDSKGAGLGG
ncbi:MAG TPA: DUF2341 domain-containing protein, partial [Bacteroidia bacterium]|nr:DUF2341 domain-containing protein [Bacteroidia bacterium]